MTPKRYIRTKPYKTTRCLQDLAIRQKDGGLSPVESDAAKKWLIELETALRVAEAEELNQ